MAIYDLKEFLTFDEVADYLTDKGVYKFDLSYEYDYKKLETLLIELVRFEKITPVFYNRSTVDVISYQYDENHKQRMKYIDGAIFLEGYYSIDPTAYEFILKNGIIKTEYPSYFSNEEADILEYHTYTVKDNMGSGSGHRKVEYNPYRLIGDYTPKTLDDCYVNYQLFADDIGIIKKDELLYPIAQLDTLFLQHQKDNLQEQINVIDNQLNDKELSPTSQKSVAKLLYALLKEHNYELGAIKGVTNDILFNLCEKHNVKSSRETIAKWLDRVNDLEK